MEVFLRPRVAPQCTTCLRNYAFGRNVDILGPGLRQQVRGKKKMVNNSSTITVRLMKDVKAYGRRGKCFAIAIYYQHTNAISGALVPISPGAMRNMWFPRRIAEYVTIPELKRLRINNVAMERDFEFGITDLAKDRGTAHDANRDWQKDIPSDIKGMNNAQLRRASALERAKMDPTDGEASMPKVMEVARVTPERSMELVELFVPPRLEFYRQPIIETKEPEKPVAERPRFGGAAGDLLAAREPKPKETRQAIYGSVSSHDILMAVRAVMSENDEAARVVLQESEIHPIDLSAEEGAEAGKLKHVGDFIVEIKVKGTEQVIQRTVRILPQEA